MYTEDFILRQIRLAMAVLLQVLRLKTAGQYQDALQSIDQALESLLGLRANLLKHLSDDKLLNMLTIQDELDFERLAILADLYREEGEILALKDHIDESQAAYQRALRFYLEVALNETKPAGTELVGKIEDIRHKLDGYSLPVETTMAVLDYLEGMQARTDKELVAAGTSRITLETEIAILNRQMKDYL